MTLSFPPQLETTSFARYEVQLNADQEALLTVNEVRAAPLFMLI
jgi:hypothetical protein